MAILVRTATEADIPSIAAVSMDAFDPSTDVISRRLFPPHLQTDDSFSRWTVARKSSRLDMQHALMTVAVENQGDGTEKVLGYAVWMGPSLPQDAKVGEAPPPPPPPPPKPKFAGMDLNALAELRQVLMQDEEETFGSQGPGNVWTLDSLGVSTGQRRRGIGRKLLEHGIELATAQGRDCYLLATPYGQPLYLAAGFQEMRSVNLFGVEYKSMHRLRRSN